MRFKDFQIVIHGDFESGDDELDLRKAISKKLGGLGATTNDIEAQNVQKIDDGEARWAPPLQQHLDVVKQSLTNANVSETSSKILDLHAAKQHYEKYHESVKPKNRSLTEEHRRLIESIDICRNCGHLIIGETITESVSANLVKSIQRKWSAIAETYTGGIKHCAHSKKRCRPLNSE